MCNLSERYIRKGLIQGLEQGLEQGREEGREETIKDTIINLLRLKSLSIEDIASALSVSIEYVEKIKDTIKCQN